MNWFFLAILAQAVYTVVVFTDKYILEKEVSDYRGIPIYSAIIAFVFGFFIWITTGYPTLSLNDACLVILTGILTIFGLATYFNALTDSEVSKVTILFQIQPIITLLLSFLILGERFSILQFFGFILILASAIGVSLEKGVNKIKFSRAFYLILLTDFFWASAYVLFKFVVDANSFSKVISYESWGIGLGGLILYACSPAVRRVFKKTAQKTGVRIVYFIIINEGIFLLSRFIKYLAISKGPVALVDVIGGTQVFMAILSGWILTIFAPKIFKENITKEGLSKKLLMAVLVLVGLWFIQG